MAYKTALCMLLLAAGAWAQDEKDEDKKKEQEAKAKLAEFNKNLKGCKRDSEYEVALQKLGEVQHAKILTELKKWLGKPSVNLVNAACDQIAKYSKNKEAAEALFKAALSRTDEISAVLCIRAIGDVGYKPIVPKLTSFFQHKQVPVAREAVAVMGKLKSKISIEPLINLLGDMEAIREDNKKKGGGGGGDTTGLVGDMAGVGGTSVGGVDIGGMGGVSVGGMDFGGGVGGGSGGGTSAAKEMQLLRKRELVTATLTALHGITGESHTDCRGWTDWWRKNKSKFKESE